MSIADLWRYFHRGCRRAPGALRLWLAHRIYGVIARLIDVTNRLDTTEVPAAMAERHMRQLIAGPPVDDRPLGHLRGHCKDADRAFDLGVAIALKSIQTGETG